MSSTLVTKAVFPVAGMGTRFLPVTKANPKEMLPIVDKPLIQYAVEEAASAGITQMIFVTSSSKHAIENHFDSNYELESKLAEDGKQELLETVRSVLPKGISCAYIRQHDALGLGHAVLCAKPFVGHHPFAVLLADDLIDSAPNTCLSQMMATFRETGHSVIAVEEVPEIDTHLYGIVAVEKCAPRLGQIQRIVEKPPQGTAPSRLAVVGRYILTPQIFECLEQTVAGNSGEIQLTDGIEKLLGNQSIYALQFEGERFDCGNKLGYLQATISYGLKHPEVGAEFRQFLQKLHQKN